MRAPDVFAEPGRQCEQLNQGARVVISSLHVQEFLVERPKPSVATQTLARLDWGCPPAPLPHPPREVSTGASQTLRLSTSVRNREQLSNIPLDP